METNVADLLSAAARAEPTKIALSEAATGRTVTWAALDDLADRVAHGLSGAGMVAGYRVMISLTNRIEFVATYLGVLRARMVAVPINPRSATGEVVRMLVDSGSRMVVADETTISTVRAAVVGVGQALETSAGDHGPAVAGPRIWRAAMRSPAPRIRSRSPSCSTPAVPLGARGRRCSATARWPPTSPKPLPWCRR
jgi:acyl-CoA synthetase (AMP-forming)/AMP-acid ligase II